MGIFTVTFERRVDPSNGDDREELVRHSLAQLWQLLQLGGGLPLPTSADPRGQGESDPIRWVSGTVDPHPRSSRTMREA